MDEDGIPIRGVDLSKVPPIPQKRTVTFMNHYISRSSQFLNDLTSVAETKLEKIFNEIQRIEESVCILEGKLSSIPGLTDGITLEPEASEPVSGEIRVVTQQPVASSRGEPLEAPDASSTTPPISEGPSRFPPSTTSTIALSTMSSREDSISDAALPDSGDNENSKESEEQPSEESAAPALTVRNDPRYFVYFDMLKKGVLKEGVQQRMTMNGVDPKLLDTPNAPAPPE